MSFLLPCPFCGNSVEVVRDHTNEGVDWIKHIEPRRWCGIVDFSNFADGRPVELLWNERAALTRAEGKE